MRGIGWLNIVRDGAVTEILNDLRFVKNADDAGGVITRNMADSDFCAVYNYKFAGCAAPGGATNTIWQITVTDASPADGDGFYPCDGVIEGPFIFNNDNAATVQGQIEGIPSFAGNVSVTGDPAFPGTMSIEFINALAGTDVVFTHACTGPDIGTSPVFTQTQVGGSGAGDSFAAIDWGASNPWVDLGSLGDTDFLGFYTEDWQGLEGDFARTANARAWGFGGSNFTPLRANHLSMTITVILGATTERGLQYGFRWLTNELMGLDACDRADLIVFDHCPPAGTAPADWIWWMIHDAGLLDAPRWGDVVLDSKNCILRRVTFVLGARDPHKYRCPVICTASTDFVVPAPATACAPDYSWSEWFCNDILDPIGCTFYAPPSDYSSRAAVLHIVAPTGAPPMEINVVLIPPGSTTLFRTTTLPAGELIIDSSRHEIRFQPDAGDEIDGSAYVAAAFGVAPVWAEMGPLGALVGIEVKPLRICGLDGVSAYIETVDRV